MKQKRFYQTSFISSLASALIKPFIPMYALSLGATEIIIGMISAFSSFFSLISQLFWSALVETTRKRNVFVVVGYILWSFSWILISFAKTPLQLLVFLAVQSSLSSMVVPAWQSILVSVVPKYKRGRINSKINLSSTLGSFIGSFIGGYLIHTYGFKYFVFYWVAFVGSLSVIPFIPYVNEKFSTYGKTFSRSLKNLINIREIKRNESFIFLVKIMMFFNFSTSIAGPMFSVYILKNLGGNAITLAILSALSTLSALIFYKPWGVLVDYLGRKTVIIGSSLPIAFFPLVYALSNHVIWLYLYEIIGSMAWGGFGIALFSYLSDIVPKESAPTYLSLYNFFVGFSAVVGSLLSGVLAEFLGMRSVFLISFALRLMALTFFYSLGEKKGTRPTGILSFFNPIDNISYQIESTVLVYSQIFEEVRKNTIESALKRLFRSFS